jgi:hypothetical protein
VDHGNQIFHLNHLLSLGARVGGHTLAEGMIDEDQFASRMSRKKGRLANLAAKIASQAADEDRRAQIPR